MKRNQSFLFLKTWKSLILPAVLLAACGREQTQVYDVPKESTTPAAIAAPAVQKPVNWTTPAVWQEHPGEGMRLASFTVVDKTGRPAEVTIVPMGGSVGTISGNVNRWRSQVNLGPIEEQEISKQLANVDIGPAQGQLYDVTSPDPILDKKANARILAAMLNRGDTTYFFKMTGAESLVGEQKPVFLQFLKSITFQEANGVPESPGAMPTPVASSSLPAPTADAGAHPNWQVPANWQPAPSSPMLVAKFIVPGAGDARADINISSSQGVGGGMAANINRWRGQLGLPSVADQAGMDKLVSELNIAGGKASCIDMSGTSQATGKAARVVAVIVPREGETWFYKLMGDSGLVEKEKAAFVQFVQTVKY